MMGDAQTPLPASGAGNSLPSLDLNNIQGDILEGLAKKREAFFFFRIKSDKLAQFRNHLAHLVPFITSATEARRFRDEIKEAKKRAARIGRGAGLIDNSAVNISFSQIGLDVLGISEDIQDGPFKEGMRANAVQKLGDNIDAWDETFTEEIHGVFLLTGNSRHLLDAAWAHVQGVFQAGQKDASIEVVKELVGHTRPGAEDGHEHFGFNDGLTQPSIQGIQSADMDGIDAPVRQGIILLGRDGDNGDAAPGAGVGSTPVSRPPWAVDGSFMAFRYLKQLVPEFDGFLEQNALEMPITAPKDAGKELLGARLVGRWKSGAPVELAPTEDDPSLALPDKNQGFRFEQNGQEKCPFAAHIRKTNPRADLDGKGGTEARRIIRRGIAFGPEVTPEEQKTHKSSDDDKLERGLLFACYQSNLSNGFQFIQQSWANNQRFPPTNIPLPGLDPLIGVAINPGEVRTLVGADPKDLDKSFPPLNPWVVSRGGEYFFSPSISALKNRFTKAS